MTNAERQRKYRERQLLNNKDEYKKIQSDYKRNNIENIIKMMKILKKKQKNQKNKNLLY